MNGCETTGLLVSITEIEMNLFLTRRVVNAPHGRKIMILPFVGKLRFDHGSMTRMTCGYRAFLKRVCLRGRNVEPNFYYKKEKKQQNQHKVVFLCNQILLNCIPLGLVFDFQCR